MLNINFYYILLFFPIFLIFICEFSLIFINYLFHVKNTIFLKNKKTKKNLNTTDNNLINLKLLNCLIIYCGFIFFNLKNVEYFCLKSNFIIKNVYYFIFLLLIFLTLIVNFLFNFYNPLQKKIINYNQYISFLFLIIVFFLLFINNFFLFIFFIELLSYIFYLQFLQLFNKIKTKNKKNFYLDSLLIFYWVNFFGTLFLVYSIYILYFYFNTSDFSELKYFLNYKKQLNIFLFFFYWI